MSLLRLLASMAGGKSVEQATRQFGIHQHPNRLYIARWLAKEHHD
jgi:hypothetical protein